MRRAKVNPDARGFFRVRACVILMSTRSRTEFLRRESARVVNIYSNFACDNFLFVRVTLNSIKTDVAGIKVTRRIKRMIINKKKKDCNVQIPFSYI